MFSQKDKALLRILIVGGALLFVGVWLFAVQAFLL